MLSTNQLTTLRKSSSSFCLSSSLAQHNTLEKAIFLREASAGKWTKVAAILTLLAGMVVVQLAIPAPAAALQTTVVQSPPTSWNTERTKGAEAHCPDGQFVVGGGAATLNEGDQQVIMLTHLIPSHTPAEDFYFAAAAAPPGFNGAWYMWAYAVCAPDADRPDGYVIVNNRTPSNQSQQFQQVLVNCPGDLRVLGTGANVSDSSGEIGIQLARSSGPRDIARATGREYRPYGAPWRVTAIAICAAPLANTTTASNVANGSSVAVGCPGGRVAHGVGGGGSLSDSGRSFLRWVQPYLGGATVQMTGLPVGGVAAQAICAPFA